VETSVGASVAPSVTPSVESAVGVSASLSAELSVELSVGLSVELSVGASVASSVLGVPVSSVPLGVLHPTSIDIAITKARISADAFKNDLFIFTLFPNAIFAFFFILTQKLYHFGCYKGVTNFGF
jgi:hypothetical protein